MEREDDTIDRAGDDTEREDSAMDAAGNDTPSAIHSFKKVGETEGESAQP